jgi:hypothetical protein
LVLAVTLGATARFIRPHGASMLAMTVLPLSLVPTFLVPRTGCYVQSKVDIKRVIHGHSRGFTLKTICQFVLAVLCTEEAEGNSSGIEVRLIDTRLCRS